MYPEYTMATHNGRLILRLVSRKLMLPVDDKMEISSHCVEVPLLMSCGSAHSWHAS